MRIPGQKAPKCFYGKTKAEADKKAARFKEQLKAGVDPTDTNITVKDWCERWLEMVCAGRKRSTQYDYCGHVRQMYRSIANMKMENVREIDLQRIVNEHSSQSSAHLHKIYTYTKRIFSSARKNKIIDIDPAIDLLKPKRGTYKGHRVLEDWEQKLVFENPYLCQASLWAVTMLFSGLRIGEILALEREDFDFEHNLIHIHSTFHFDDEPDNDEGTTKTPAGVRSVPMYEPLLSIIKNSPYYKSGKRKFATTSRNGRLITESSYRSQWKAYMTNLGRIATGLPPSYYLSQKRKDALGDRLIKVKFTAHDLRYTYATMLYEADVDEKTSQLWMGHTSPKMTRDLYAKLTAAKKARSDHKLETYLSASFLNTSQSDPPDTREQPIIGTSDKNGKTDM